MANFNRQYAQADSHKKNAEAELDYWREVGVKAEANNEKSTRELSDFIKGRIGKYTLDAIKEIVGLCDGEFSEKDTKESLIELLCSLSHEEKLLLCNLHDFTNRKKKTIDDYFKSFSQKANYTIPLSKVYYLMKDSPAHLLSIRTLNIWQNHSSGCIYGLDKTIKREIAEKIATEGTFEKELINKLYKASGEKNKYKIHSYCQFDGNFLIHLYKLIDDGPKEDFKRAIRNQAISRITFSINPEKKLIEIRTKSYTEEWAIKEYLEKTFEGHAVKIEEDVYSELNQEVVKAAILEGKTPSGKQVDDFLVDRMKFRESSLENSPSLILSVENIDIWPSVYDASEKGAISITSIKSIESISFRSEGTRRTVFSSILDNGNVVFQMDDSRLSEDKKKKLSDKFYERFGLPLYKQISNIGSQDGAVDLVDYIMKSRTEISLDPAIKSKEDELYKLGLLKEKTIIKSSCKNRTCTYEEILSDASEKIEECPDCESEIKVSYETCSVIDKKQIDKYIVRELKEICKTEEWEYHGISKRKIAGEEFVFLKMEKCDAGKILKVLISTETISSYALTRMKKFLDPTLIISVGQSSKALERYSTGCFAAVSFGNFYERDTADLKNLLQRTFKTLTLKTKGFIADAATESYKTIKSNVGNPKANKYEPSDFEDDTYVLLKDFFINVQKWGHENIGQELPEGVFTLYYESNEGRKTIPSKLAFSYDCKLNKDLKGFSFSVGERDKAIRYIESLSDSIELSQFTNSKHLDGHIFISNKYQTTNAENTYKAIRKKIQKDYDTEIIFMTTGALLYLHEQYREHYALIEGSRDNFMLLLNQAFVSLNGNLFSEEYVDAIMKKTLKYAHKKVVDFQEITKDLTEELFKIMHA